MRLTSLHVKALCPLWQDSPTNKLLYAKEIPEYKKRVQCYYRQIQEMAPLSEQEMNAHLAEESRVSAAPAPAPAGRCRRHRQRRPPDGQTLLQKYRNEFNTNLALTEIYKYAKRYRNQVGASSKLHIFAREFGDFFFGGGGDFQVLIFHSLEAYFPPLARSCTPLNPRKWAGPHFVMSQNEEPPPAAAAMD